MKTLRVSSDAKINWVLLFVRNCVVPVHSLNNWAGRGGAMNEP